MPRRLLALCVLALVAYSLSPSDRTTAAEPAGAQPKYNESVRRHILFFNRSAGFEHDPIKIKKPGEPSEAGKVLIELGKQHNWEITETKDGTVFTPENIAKYDAFFFYATGDLTSPKSREGKDISTPPISPDGKALLLKAIENGKGFIGTHAAADCSHYAENGENMGKAEAERYKNHGDKADPYINMLGGEFIHHDAKQHAVLNVIDPSFPGLGGAGAQLQTGEGEWYSLKDFKKDLHVILVQDTAGMNGADYKRPNYPQTWIRLHGKGRVFYTSLGHGPYSLGGKQEPGVWPEAGFQSLLVGGISWAVHNIDADTTPNIEKVTPQAWQNPPHGKAASQPAAG